MSTASSAVLRVCLGACLAASVAACRMPSLPSSPSENVGGAGGTNFDAEIAYCVSEINSYRSRAGKAPLAHLAEGQDFSVEAARVDGEHHEAHRYFRATNGGNGTAMAENEIPWWVLSRYGSVRTVIREGLAMMWAEGPGGGHYENMIADYRAVSCGISIANGEVTVTQDFR